MSDRCHCTGCARDFADPDAFEAHIVRGPRVGKEKQLGPRISCGDPSDLLQLKQLRGVWTLR